MDGAGAPPLAVLPGRFWDKVAAMPWKDFLLSVVWYFAATFLMCYVMNFVDARMPDPDTNPVLPDIVQDIWSVQQNSTLGREIQLVSNVMFFGNAFTCTTLIAYAYGMPFASQPRHPPTHLNNNMQQQLHCTPLLHT